MDEQLERDRRRIARFRNKRLRERERKHRIQDRRAAIPMPPDHLSTAALAAAVGLSSPHTIVAMMKRGDIPLPSYERVVTTLNGLSKRTWRFWHISNLADVQRAADELKLRDPRAGKLFARSAATSSPPSPPSPAVAEVDAELDKVEMDL